MKAQKDEVLEIVQPFRPWWQMHNAPYGRPYTLAN